MWSWVAAAPNWFEKVDGWLRRRGSVREVVFAAPAIERGGVLAALLVDGDVIGIKQR